MRVLGLCLPLLLSAPSFAPVAVGASRAAAASAVLPDDCPLYTDVLDDLEDMGIDPFDHEVTGEGDVECLSMVEWGYTGEEDPPAGFGVYLYLFDPAGTRAWASTGTVSMAFSDRGGAFYDNAFRSLRMVLVDSYGAFSKWRLSDAASVYPLLAPAERAYLVGSCTLTTTSGTDLSFPLGTEFVWTGLPRVEGVNDVSTLVMEKTPFRAVRAEVYPFTSALGTVRGRTKAPNRHNPEAFRLDLSAFSVAFSLPSWAEDFGELYSVHYEYWKYRTDWVAITSSADDYEAVGSFVGTSSLDGDMEYVGETPDVGWIFYAPFDVDDFADVTDDLPGGHPPYMRSYNALQDGDQKATRLDNPTWLFLVSGEEWEEGVRISSDELEAYAASYVDHDPSGDLPVLNGTVSDELFYVPGYSEDDRFQKYGHVDSTASREDFLASDLDSMLQSRLSTSATVVTGFYPFFGPGNNNFYKDYLTVNGIGENFGNETTEMSTYAIYREALEATEPDASLLFGPDSVPLLSDWSDSDFIVGSAHDEYKDGLSSFVAVEEGQGKAVYRLTYDACLSDYYDCNVGSPAMDNGLWTGSNMAMAKTDAVFDFRFIDFTFVDEDRAYTLPAASDPFDQSGPISGDPHPSGLPGWLVAVIVVACVLVALLVLSLLFPVLKGVVRGIGYAFQIVIDLAYLVLVWWWLAIIRKIQGEELPPAWIWRKG